MKTDEIVILGCGGHARSVANVILENSQDARLVFVDENAKSGEKILGFPTKKILPKNCENLFVSIGDNERRRELSEGKKLISIVSKSASIGIFAKIGDGVFIAQGAHVGPEAKIGRGTIINTNSVVEHEVQIGDFCHIAPNATICGRCKIGGNVFIGAGATVKDKIEICGNVTVGAGAVVVENITKAGVYVGTPARRVERCGL